MVCTPRQSRAKRIQAVAADMVDKDAAAVSEVAVAVPVTAHGSLMRFRMVLHMETV